MIFRVSAFISCQPVKLAVRGVSWDGLTLPSLQAFVQTVTYVWTTLLPDSHIPFTSSPYNAIQGHFIQEAFSKLRELTLKRESIME